MNTNNCKFIFLTILSVLIISFANAQKSPIIKGIIENNKYENVELKSAYNNSNIIYGSSKISANGSFSIKTTVTTTDIYKLSFSEKDFFLFVLSPDQTIDVVIDANNLRDIKSVSGSKEMDFVKSVSDLLNYSKVLIDTINYALKNNPEQNYFNNFYQSFNLFHQTNQDIDKYMVTIFSCNDSLNKLINSSTVDGKVDAKKLDNFVYQANKYFKEIENAYIPFENYKQNANSYYNFTNNRIEGQKDFYELVDRYLDLLDERHKLATTNFDTYIAQIKSIIALRDSLVYNQLIDKKKEKSNLANEMVTVFNNYISKRGENESLYLIKAQASENVTQDLFTMAKNKISEIVAKYQNEYNTKNESINQQVLELIKANKDNLAVLMFIDIFPRDKNAALHSEVIKALYAKYPDHQLVQERYKIENSPANATAIGAMAPELAFLNPDGKLLKLSDLRGKVVLIDFWASWCRPCRNENPHVVAMYNKYNSKGFEVYSVSLDRDKNGWVKAIADDKLTWPNHVSDLKYWQSEGAKLYGVNSIPCTFLIDREGRIIAKNLRGEALTKALKEIFGE